jgi:hypothetical protein
VFPSRNELKFYILLKKNSVYVNRIHKHNDHFFNSIQRIIKLKMNLFLHLIKHSGECTFTCKLSISLVTPEILSGILNSVITKLPPGNFFLAGTERDDLYVYYEYAKVSAVS